MIKYKALKHDVDNETHGHHLINTRREGEAEVRVRC